MAEQPTKAQRCKCGHLSQKHTAKKDVPACPLHYYLLADEHCECGWRQCFVRGCSCRRYEKERRRA